MRKGCLGPIVIGCRTEDVLAASASWSAALGYEAQATDAPREDFVTRAMVRWDSAEVR